MKTFRLLTLFILLTFALGVAQPAYAAPPGIPGLNDEVCFGGTQTVREGSEVNGSLVSFGCVVVVEDSAVVNGDVVAFGGTVDINGEITGELVAMGTAVTLDENALILGDLIAPGSSIFRQDGSEVEGQTITESGTDAIEIPDIPGIPEVPNVPDITIVPPAQPQSFLERSANLAVREVTNALLRLFQTFAFSALAVLLIIFIPKHTERVANAIVAQPIVTGGVGFLTGLLAPIVLIVLTLLTVFILSPLTALGALILGLAGVFGWIAVGYEVGHRLEEAFKQNWAPPLQAGVGTFFLTLGVAAIGIIWPLGVFAVVLVISIGLGAVVMTRFGTREYLGPAPAATVEDVEPEADPEPEAKPKPKRRTTRKKTEK